MFKVSNKDLKLSPSKKSATANKFHKSYTSVMSVLGDIQKVRSLKIPEFWPPSPLVRPCSFSPKVNLKSTICHDFPSPDLLEGPKDGKIKENANFFFILTSSSKVY